MVRTYPFVAPNDQFLFQALMHSVTLRCASLTMLGGIVSALLIGLSRFSSRHAVRVDSATSGSTCSLPREQWTLQSMQSASPRTIWRLSVPSLKPLAGPSPTAMASPRTFTTLRLAATATCMTRSSPSSTNRAQRHDEADSRPWGPSTFFGHRRTFFSTFNPRSSMRYCAVFLRNPRCRRRRQPPGNSKVSSPSYAQAVFLIISFEYYRASLNQR